jgi:Flp pilus assembly protein TadG
MNRSRHPLGLLRDRSGAAAVEFALILPLMSVLLFGFFEAGRMFYTFNIASAAARDAARFGARLPMTCSGFVSGTDEMRVKTLAATGDANVGADPLIAGMTTANIAVAYACVSNAGSPRPYAGVYEDATGVPTLKVTVNAPFQTVFSSLLPSLNVNGMSVSHSETWTE